MPGKQANVAKLGSINEADSIAILKRLSSVVKVPREEDYGIDFFCQELTKETTTSHQARSIYGVQIKPKLDDYVLGEFDNKGKWKEYQLAWYRALSIPYFLGIIANSGNELSIYSLISLKCVFHKTNSTPYQIKVKSEYDNNSFRFQEPVNNSDTSYEKWVCNLGPPVIKFDRSQADDPIFINNCKIVLSKWISLDRINAIFLAFGIDRVMSYKTWGTNIIHNNDELTIWDYWTKPLSKMTLYSLSRIAGPCLALMNKNYEESNDNQSLPGVKELHQWMKDNGLNDPYISIFEKST